MADDDNPRSSTDASEEEEEDDEPVDYLVQGRTRRSNAGRNMSALLDAEADDDLNLLFAEIDDDIDFSADAEAPADGDGDADDDYGQEDDDEDMRIDSSSDDDEDDQGQGDELEGEKELEKQAKADRKKRKAQEGLRLQSFRKKAKIDPITATTTSTTETTTAEPTTRQRKKSERISWLPTPDEGPTRSSSRRQTMQNKQVTHARLKDSEQKRVKLIASMEEAARKKAQQKPKEMTQEQRLAEAERVERLNSRSLNRWEEMEKRKADERHLKLQALQNRRLEGPVMSWWSGIATWTDGVLTQLGKVDVSKKHKEEVARKKVKQDKAERKAQQSHTMATSATVSGESTPAGPTDDMDRSVKDSAAPSTTDLAADMGNNAKDSTSPGEANDAADTTKTETHEPEADPSTAPSPEHIATTYEPATTGSPKEVPTTNAPEASEQRPTGHEEPKIEYTGRDLIVMENFDDKTARSQDYSIYFNAKKPSRLSSTFPYK